MKRKLRLLASLPLLATAACAADAIAAPEPAPRPSARLAAAPRAAPAPGVGASSAIDVVTRGRQPLWVVDGVVTMLQPRLDPSDIASLEVLTDTSVSCCSGGRCPEVVILITTRSGSR